MGERVTTRRHLTEAAKHIEHGGKEAVQKALDFLRQSDDVIVQKALGLSVATARRPGATSAGATSGCQPVAETS